ncbi:MAG: peptide ABC transporter substrate-binding protein [Rhodospirillaceae bacterium]|nr:MAG: peptide ABC transporter substrate-binding protein [Rhodospirillaceae bacterium]
MLRRCVAVAILVISFVGAAHAEAILQRGIRLEPASLDPHKYNTRYEAAIVLDLFEGLVAFGVDGTPQPGLAQRWSSSADGRTWTFTLRPHLQWSDGTPLTADDVVFSLRRLMDPKTAAIYAPLMYVLKNGHAVNTGALPVEALGVAAPSADTVVLDLENPTPYLPELLANGFLAVVPPQAIAAWGDGWTKVEHMVTDGGFVLTKWSPQNRIVLARNPRYHDADKVALDGVVYYPSPDLDAAVTRFRAGELDMQSDFASGRMEQLRAELPHELYIAPALETFYLALNTALPKLADRRVRLALSLAIDRDLLAAKVLRDGSVAARSFAPPTTTGYEPATMAFLDAPMESRLAQARDLLAQAGYGPDRPLTLTYSHSTAGESKRVAIAVAAMWKQIGVKVTLSGTEGKVMFANLRQGNFEVAFADWTADFNDAASFLYPLQSTSVSSNYSRYSNPAYDGLLAQAATTTDRRARADLLRLAEALILADQPILPLAVGVSKNLVSPQVRGWAPNAVDVYLSRYFSVDREGRTLQ